MSGTFPATSVWPLGVIVLEALGHEAVSVPRAERHKWPWAFLWQHLDHPPRVGIEIR